MTQFVSNLYDYDDPTRPYRRMEAAMKIMLTLSKDKDIALREIEDVRLLIIHSHDQTKGLFAEPLSRTEAA